MWCILRQKLFQHFIKRSNKFKIMNHFFEEIFQPNVFWRKVENKFPNTYLQIFLLYNNNKVFSLYLEYMRIWKKLSIIQIEMLLILKRLSLLELDNKHFKTVLFCIIKYLFQLKRYNSILNYLIFLNSRIKKTHYLWKKDNGF